MCFCVFSTVMARNCQEWPGMDFHLDGIWSSTLYRAYADDERRYGTHVVERIRGTVKH